MKIKQVKANNHKHAFEITVQGGREFEFPYSQLRLKPTPENPIATVEPDKEIGNEGFTYFLRNGQEDTVHIDHVLHYTEEPNYLVELLLHKLTIELKKAFQRSGITMNELLRRLETSPSQFSRLCDPTNKTKSVDQMLRAIQACNVNVNVSVDGRDLLEHTSKGELVR